MNAYLVTYKKLNGEDRGAEYRELLGKYSVKNKSFFVLSSQFRNKKMSSFDSSSRYMYATIDELMLRKKEIENYVNDLNFIETDYKASYEPVEFNITNYKDFNFPEVEQFAEDVEKYGKKGLN